MHTIARGAKLEKAPPFFLPYQSRWVADNSRLKLWEKGRQLGATWTEAYNDAQQCAGPAALDSWVSSRDTKQAKLYIADARKFARVMDKWASRRGKLVLLPKPVDSSFELEFATGRTITALGSNADAQAGKRGRRVLDEFAIHRDPKNLFGIAYPGITWGGSLSIISTHRGSLNYFNELIREIKEGGNPKGISLHTTRLSDALKEGLLAKIKSKLPAEDARQAMDDADYWNFIRAGCPDEETFGEEFECQPADDKGAFIASDLITACEYTSDEHWLLPSLVECGQLYLGVDIGRTRDLTVFWLFELVGDVLHTRRLVVLEKTPFHVQEAALYEFLDLPGLVRCCIDESGIGRQLAEEAQRRYGYKVEPVTFTNASKEALAYPLRSRFEQRTIRIPDDRVLRADLHSVRKEYTAANNVRFAGDRGANGHADRFWAGALGVHAADNPSVFAASVIG